MGAKKLPRPHNRQANYDLPLFKQLTRVVIDSFPTPGKRHSTFELSAEDLKLLQEFKDNDIHDEKIADVLEIIIHLFEHAQIEERLKHTFLFRILSTVEYHKELFAVSFLIIITISMWLIFEIRTTMTWYQQCWYLFWFLFVVSIPWEWFRLYRKEFAEKQAEIIKEIPLQCVPMNMTISERMLLWMSELLSWKEDGCRKFQEAILVDPLWEVSPSLVNVF